jgi:lipoyl(octanoyl) transferase
MSEPVGGSRGRRERTAEEELVVSCLGTMAYPKALGLQTELQSTRRAGASPDTLLLLEHPPVYTRGRHTRVEDLPLPTEWYLEQGIAIEPSDRGDG